MDYEELSEAGVPARRYFRRRRPPFPPNLHVVWTTLWSEDLTLRDYLRAHPQEADDYGRQKREILAPGRRDLARSSDAKSPLLKGINSQMGATNQKAGTAQRRSRTSYRSGITIARFTVGRGPGRCSQGGGGILWRPQRLLVRNIGQMIRQSVPIGRSTRHCLGLH
jgi:GrpB protein